MMGSCRHGGRAANYNAVVGEHERYKSEGTETVHTVDAIFEHSQYDSRTTNNDNALLKLTKEIAFNDYVSPACLPDKDVAKDTICVTTGWGETRSG